MQTEPRGLRGRVVPNLRVILGREPTPIEQRFAREGRCVYCGSRKPGWSGALGTIVKRTECRLCAMARFGIKMSDTDTREEE